MPKLKRTTKAEQAQAYMSRVAKFLFFRLSCIGYDREKVSKLFGVDPATCSARKNNKPQNLRLEEIVRAAEVLGIEPHELLIDPNKMKGGITNGTQTH